MPAQFSASISAPAAAPDGGDGRVDDLPSGLASDHVYVCVRTSFSSLSSTTLILLVAKGSLMSFKNEK
jgi:hypothetical protein